MIYPTPTPWVCREVETSRSLVIENSSGQQVCRFYSVSPIDRANADFIVTLANSWGNQDALRTRITQLVQLYSPTDSIDSPQEAL